MQAKSTNSELRSTPNSGRDRETQPPLHSEKSVRGNGSSKVAELIDFVYSRYTQDYYPAYELVRDSLASVLTSSEESRQRFAYSKLDTIDFDEGMSDLIYRNTIELARKWEQTQHVSNELLVKLARRLKRPHELLEPSLEAKSIDGACVTETPVATEVRGKVAKDEVQKQNTGKQVADSLATLTDEERIVAKLMLAGVPNKVIAFDLDMYPRTVDRRRQAVLTKMGAHSVSDLQNILCECSDTVSTDSRFHDSVVTESSLCTEQQIEDTCQVGQSASTPAQRWSAEGILAELEYFQGEMIDLDLEEAQITLAGVKRALDALQRYVAIKTQSEVTSEPLSDRYATRSERVSEVIMLLDAKPSEDVDVAAKEMEHLLGLVRSEIAERLTHIISSKMQSMSSHD